MSEAGREPSRVEARPVPTVEAIASAYLIEAGGDLAAALRRAIADALADLTEMERRTQQAERLVSRGYLRMQNNAVGPQSANARHPGLIRTAQGRSILS